MIVNVINKRERMKLPQRGSWLAKALMIIFGHPVIALLFFALLGAIGGWLTVPHAQNDRIEMVSVGAVWGAFVGAIFVAREVSSRRWIRRAIGLAVGAVAGGITGVVLGWSGINSIALALGFAVLGYFGNIWAKHLTFP